MSYPLLRWVSLCGGSILILVVVFDHGRLIFGNSARISPWLKKLSMTALPICPRFCVPVASHSQGSSAHASNFSSTSFAHLSPSSLVQPIEVSFGLAARRRPVPIVDAFACSTAPDSQPLLCIMSMVRDAAQM